MQIARRLRSYCYKCFLEEGLLLDKSDHLHFESDLSNYKITVAKDIIDKVFAYDKNPPIQLPTEIYDRLLRPITFGYLEATTIHFLLGGSKYISEKIGEIGGIYVAWVCYFDEFCDKYPNLTSDIANLIDEKIILNAFNNKSYNENIFLKNISKDVNDKLIPLLVLWQYYISSCRELFDFSRRVDVWDDFVKTIVSQYFQQLEYVGEKIPNFNPNLWDETKIRSSSPLWVNFLINFLSSDTKKEFYSKNLKDAILGFGEVTKIIDDIIDILDDLYDRRWNYVLIKTRNSYPNIFDDINKNNNEIEIIEYIINNGLIDESIKDAIGLYFDAIKNIKDLGLYDKKFESYIKLFLSNWFKSELFR